MISKTGAMTMCEEEDTREEIDWRNTTLKLPDRLGHILRKELYPDTEILVGNADTGRVSTILPPMHSFRYTSLNVFTLTRYYN